MTVSELRELIEDAEEKINSALLDLRSESGDCIKHLDLNIVRHTGISGTDGIPVIRLEVQI